MAFWEFPDGNGNTVRVLEWDGRVFSGTRTLNHWHGVSAMASRHDDVLLCGYPKSGNHWLWEIVTMLKRGSTHLLSSHMEAQGFLMIASAADLDALPSPRILTTHRRFHDLPTDFIAKHRKMVCVLRDPKDICVSYYHMIRGVKHFNYDGTFQGFVPLFLAGHVPMGLWAGWVQSFEKGLREHPELSVHVVHYEQLKANPVEEIKRLARYLGCPESLAEDVARQTQFSAMKTFKESMPNRDARFYKNKSGNIFRKGETEQWKQYFSAEEAERFSAQLKKDLGRPAVKSSL